MVPPAEDKTTTVAAVAKLVTAMPFGGICSGTKLACIVYVVPPVTGIVIEASATVLAPSGVEKIQSWNANPVSAVAVKVTDVPSGYVWDPGVGSVDPPIVSLIITVASPWALTLAFTTAKTSNDISKVKAKIFLDFIILLFLQYKACLLVSSLTKYFYI